MHFMVVSTLSSLSLLPCAGVCGQQAFRMEPRNVTVRAGATALLKCEVLRASGTVQWVKDGLLLGPHRSLPGHPRYTITGDENRGEKQGEMERTNHGKLLNICSGKMVVLC